MADLKISELSALAGANLVAADELAIVDDSASETKKITVADLIANGVTVISDDTIPGAKILFGSGDIATAALADSAVTTAKVAEDAITAAKLANESTVDLVTTLPASGAFTGQLALDTDDNSLYAWDGSTWRSIVAPGSVANINGSTTGEINIVTTTSGTSVTISATIDDTTSAAQFLAGPTGSAGSVGYRTIVGSDLPTATTSAKGGVIVNGNGLTLSGDTLEIDNSVTSSATHHVVTYDANGLITGGRAITSADLPAATTTALGGVIVSDGLTVDVAGNLSIDNSVTSGTYTKVTVTAEGLVSSVDNLGADDIPNHSAAKLTSGTIGTSLIANDAITADKIADQSTTKFGGAAGSDNVTIFPTGDFQGQFFYDETTQDLYIYTGSSFVPITVLSGNLVNAGAYNASTNQMSSVTSAGSSAGFSVGAALPAPAQTNLNHYVVVDTSGTGTGAAPAVALAPPDMLLSQGVGTEYSLIDVSNAIAGQTASNISLIATGNIVATDVQAGIQELDTEKLQKAGDTMTGALGIGTASSIVFEGSTADDYETTLTVTDPTADRTITFPDVTGNVVTTGDTGTVTSTMITDGTIVNADINASAEIAVSKLADGAAYQILHTDSSGTGVEWTSNVDIPGTLDVTSTATFDSTVTAAGLITANGKVSFPAGTAAAPSLYSGTDIDTGIYAPAANEFGVATAGQSRLVIDSSGNVIIGTTAAATDSRLTVRAVSPALSLYATPGNESFLNMGDTDDHNIGRITYNNSDNSMRFDTNADERMRLDSSGRLSLGATSSTVLSTFALDSSNAYSSTGNISNDNVGLKLFNTNGSDGTGANNYTGIQFNVASGATSSGSLAYVRTADNQGAFVFNQRTGASSYAEAMRIDSSGFIHQKFTSNNSSTPEGLFINNQNNATGNNASLIFSNDSGNRKKVAIAAVDVGDYGASDLVFALDGTDSGSVSLSSDEKMRITSSGSLIIGDTSTSNAASYADNLVIGTTTGDNGMTIVSATNAYGTINFSAGTGASATKGIIQYYHDEDFMRFYTADFERMRIDSSGRLLVGTSSSRIVEDHAGNGPQGKIQIEGTNSDAIMSIISAGTADANRSGTLSLGRHRNSTIGGTPTIVQNGDSLGAICFAGGDGTDMRTKAAKIVCEVDGAPGANDMPGRLVFSTTEDGASSPTERMLVRANGLLQVYAAYTSTTAAAANVSVDSSGYFQRSTSSAKYKTNVETLQDSYSDALLNCRPVWYQSTCEKDNPDWGWWGFIAEEVAEIDPRLVHWKTVKVTHDEKGSAVETPCDPEPEGVAYDRFVPHLLNLIKRQGEAIAELQAEVAALKAS